MCFGSIQGVIQRARNGGPNIIIRVLVVFTDSDVLAVPRIGIRVVPKSPQGIVRVQPIEDKRIIVGQINLHGIFWNG